jgi:predicted DNA binding CopG/RHH family protein
MATAYEKKSERITIRLTESERRAIEARAAGFGLNMNFMIRRMLLIGLKSQSSKRMVLSAVSGHKATA